MVPKEPVEPGPWMFTHRSGERPRHGLVAGAPLALPQLCAGRFGLRMAAGQTVRLSWDLFWDLFWDWDWLSGFVGALVGFSTGFSRIGYGIFHGFQRGQQQTGICWARISFYWSRTILTYSDHEPNAQQTVAVSLSGKHYVWSLVADKRTPTKSPRAGHRAVPGGGLAQGL